MGRNIKFILVAIIAYLPCVKNPMYAKTIVVKNDKQANSIGIAVSKTKNGDTVEVKAGYYHEKNIVVNNEITLISNENANINGDNRYEIITVTVPNVVIKGFCLLNTGVSATEDLAAVRIKYTHHVAVQYNTIENAFFGVYSEQSTDCLIEGNTMLSTGVDESNNGDGIHCWKSERLIIFNNYIQKHRDGIYLEFVTDSYIKNNTSTQNVRYGLHFMFSHRDEYSQNTFYNNGAGVAVMYSKSVHMVKNVFVDNWGSASYGLLLKDITDSHIEYNTFKKNTTGIYFEGSNRLKLDHNTFVSNGWAIKIQASCETVTVDSNNFELNTFDISTNGSLVMNSFDRNYWDKYDGYDLKRDGFGDVPYHPVSLYSMLTEQNPSTLILLRSFLTGMLDQAEKMIPSITPDNLRDNTPLMLPLDL